MNHDPNNLRDLAGRLYELGNLNGVERGGYVEKRVTQIKRLQTPLQALQGEVIILLLRELHQGQRGDIDPVLHINIR